MKFTNSAGQPITLGQAAFAYSVYLLGGGAIVALGWATLVLVFGAGPV